MAQIEVETQPRGGVVPTPGRFACPLCGSMLRVGAILCPHCDADLWTMAHGGPPPSPQAEGASVADASAPGDGRGSRRPIAIRYALLTAAVAFLASMFITWSIDRVIANLHP